MQQPKILVAIRKRPLSKKESSKNETDIVTVKNGETVIVSEYKQKVDLTKFLQDSIFNFDFAFNEQTQNEQIYDQAVRPLVDSAFQGAKVTCFAYGQTGSGKTYTMNGSMGHGIPGLYTLGANDIFYYLSSPQFSHLKAKLSFYEIYCGKLYDLLNKRSELKLREDNKNNINIIGLEEASVTSSQEFIEYLNLGSHQRVTSQNSANADSSRSHAILQISLKDGKKLHGKISFIDLAGNQRGADHMDMDKQTRIDGAQINKSLLSLKECIRALDQGKGHTPFRGSKLTMVLKDSFVGFCRTIMIGNVSPSSASSQNTLNTLRYADRVKQLRKPHQNGSKQDMKAKQLMLPRQNKNAIRIMITNEDDAEDIARKRDEAQKQYGVHEEVIPKKPPGQKEQYNSRKNSAMNKQPNQFVGKTQQKSNSLSKVLLPNNFKQPQNNNFMPSNPNAANNKPTVPMVNNNRARNQGMEVKYENNIQNRYISNQRQREQPMQVQSPCQTPFYAVNNKHMSSSNNARYNNNYNQQFQPTNNNYNFPSQNTSNNYSSMGLNQHSQIINRTIMPQSQFNNNRQINQNGNFINNNTYNGYQKNFPNKAMNPIQGRQIPQHQPQFQIPSKWQQMVETLNTYQDPSMNSLIVCEMGKRLLAEQNELISDHSQTVRKQIDMIKSQMNVLNDMKIDMSKITSRGYVQFMQESIEDKISILQMLRQKMICFTYKLDQMEQIEQLGVGKRPSLDDEQLLDDIN